MGHRDTNGAFPLPSALLDRVELKPVGLALGFSADPATWETGVRFEHDHPVPLRARDALEGTTL